MRARPDRPRRLRRARRVVATAGLAACAAGAVAVVPAGAPGKAVAVRRPVAAAAAPAAPRRQAAPAGAGGGRDAGDTAGGLDPTPVQPGRAPDGRLRAALTLAAPWRTRDLPAEDGPPGSLCLRMWTGPEEPGSFPDRLLCITADARGRHMRASMLVERGGVLVRVGGATI